jgi:hypothetical protein
VIRRASEDLLHGSGRGDARSLSASLFENDGVGDLMRDTIRLLRDNWPLVESLVAALLSHGTLSQDQLTAIYSDFRDSPT